LAAGEIGFESDTGKIKIGTGSTAWNALAYTASSTAVTYLFNATGGQTTFTGADANGLTLAYTVGAEQVYLNGVLQVRGSDYTATNGTSIVLASGALVSDVLNVIAYSAMTVTDTYTQAQADAKFVQQTNNFFAGKNKVINGAFDNWQRGTSFALPNATWTYTADRFACIAPSGTTVSRQAFAPGTAPVAGYEGTYYFNQTITANSQNYESIQRVEDARTFAGQTVTLSFWARSTVGAQPLNVAIIQDFGTGGSPSSLATATYVSGSGTPYTPTSSWARYTFTFSVPSVAGKTFGTNNNSYLWVRLFQYTTTATNTSIDIWGVQLEAGSIATPFQTATGTIQGELAACQRYYWRSTTTNNYGRLTAFCPAASTTGVYLTTTPPVKPRVPITAVEYSNIALYDGNAIVATISSISLGDPSNDLNTVNVVCTGLTQYRPYAILANNNAAGYIGFSAEL
jgi:hypothetical protein